MNRHERRRQQREQTHRATKITSLGGHFSTANLTNYQTDRLEEELPPGRHLWIVTVIYTCTEESAYNSVTPGATPILLDQENIAQVITACFRCETPIQDIPRGTPCPGPSHG